VSGTRPRLDWIARPGAPLRGRIRVPGDKSISHRAIMLGSLADGTTRIDGFLEGEDTRATAAAFRAMGVRIETPMPGARIVHGVGIDGLSAPSAPLDCGNAGTAMRLLAGVLAGQSFASTLVGDDSLSRRPMRRVLEPLARMGARIRARDDACAPLVIEPSPSGLTAIDWRCPVASAQVKSAILLAGLRARGTTRVAEPQPTRDHTERMLAAFGHPVRADREWIGVDGGGRLVATDIEVPSDFSSAAFFVVAACVVPDSDLVIERVGVNPLRTGLLRALRMMGAAIEVIAPDVVGGEPVADLRVRAAPLVGIDLPESLVADMIDEFPAFFVAAALAEGTTRIRGAAELRVKESDRIAAMTAALAGLGARIEERPDGALIDGLPRLRGGHVDSRGDHRIAMAAAVAAQRAGGPVTIADCRNVDTSFPGFVALARTAGLDLEQAAGPDAAATIAG
jgi:3-phosphoshikimate 1-carboxyvinyltransferase